MEQKPPASNNAIPDDDDDPYGSEEEKEEKIKLLKLRVFINIEEEDMSEAAKALDLTKLFKRVDPKLSFYKDVR